MSTDTSTDTDPADIPLVDHHCHGVVAAELDRPAFEALMSESDRPGPAGTTAFDSQVGFAIRAHCAPLLDLPAFASPEDYVRHRRELGCSEANRRLLRAARIEDFLVETGHRAEAILGVEEMAQVAGSRTHEIVRLERLAETLLAQGCSPAGFRAAFADELDRRLTTAIGVKSIAAYRVGLDLEGARPSPTEVDVALSRWARELSQGRPVRLADPVIIRHLIWEAVDRQTVLQFHVGYGDPDVDLHRCNPLLLTDFFRRTRDCGSRLTLLHCYPYHREAGYAAHVFPHVYFDVGLALNYVGSRAEAIVAESLELAPFHKILFSSDAFGLAELYALGALLFRRGLSAALDRFAEIDGWPIEERRRVATMIGAGNARRCYGLEEVAGRDR